MNEPQPKRPGEESDPAPETESTTPAEEKPDDGPQVEIARLKDQLLRALAEAENSRRRAQKEREDTAKYATANFAKEMLAVADNFQRALEAVPKDVRGNEALKNLVAGIEATERQLQAALARFGIKKIEPLGEVFDPNFHRAMMEMEDTEKPPGTVVQVLQPGYVIHDRLLREALVAVAKGAPPSAPKVDRSA
jgi:molecular chaperone GrpE